MPDKTRSIGSFTPITPVLATSTSSGRQPMAAAVSVGHLYGMRQPVIPGASVGAAAVDDDGARPPIGSLEVLPRDLYGRSLRQIRGEESRSAGRRFGRDHGQIER